MIPRPVLLTILLSLFFRASGFTQDFHRFDLGGSWMFRQAGNTEWKKAVVPGTVHQDLLRNGLIKDPYLLDHEQELQWISETGWEYRDEFTLSDTMFRYQHLDLVMKGIDTYANVYVNDSLVLVADNMFREWFADVRKILHPGKNEILVQFPSVLQQNHLKYEKLPHKLPGDEKVVCRKAAYQFGWDWSPVYATSGIWRPVYLRAWTGLNVLGVQYTQQLLTDSVARLNAVFTVSSRFEDSARFIIRLKGTTLATISQLMKKGVNVVRVPIRLEKPERWWCNGMGDPYLYPFEHFVYLGTRLCGQATTRIGLRTIELVENPDFIGRTFGFKLNGVPVFMKGANFVPPDNFLPAVTDSVYRSLIRSAAEANMNMLRVWGGGTYEKDLFYDLCDEYGILVWQDFIFACALYPGDRDFLRNVQVEAIQNVVRLRNHPSIAVWCGNNEIDEAWKNWGWQKQYAYTAADSTEVWNDYRMIFNDILPTTVSKFDTLRPYVVSSPRHGWGRKESLLEGDLHYWGVWWGKEPFETYRKKVGKFVSEYGFQGFPSLRTIRKFTRPEDRTLWSPVMKAHQKHPTGFETIDEYMKRDYPAPKDFDSYALVSQVLQADGMKIAMEAHRNAKLYCMGSLFWQLNDCWPAVSWSAIDYYGDKKALYYTARKSFEKIHASPVVEDGKFRVYVVNDSLKNFAADLRVRLVDYSGKTVSDTVVEILVSENSAEFYYQVPMLKLADTAALKSMVCQVGLMVGKRLVSENTLWFSEYREQPLQIARIRKTIQPAKGGYRITLSTDKPARRVFLSAPGNGEFSDNFFDLLPGETRTVFIRTGIRFEDLVEKLSIRSLADMF